MNILMWRPAFQNGLVMCSSVVLLITILLANIISSQAYLITLDAGVENECFHEKVPVGTKLGFSFEVIEGGFYDVDMEIKDPTNVIIHQDERSSSGKFTIEATLDGPYQFCFHNRKVSFAPKVIIFDIDKAEPGSQTGSNTAPISSSNNAADDSETSKLASMINQLMLSTISARHDVRYLTARDRVHRRVNEKTNTTIVWWSGLEFLLLLAVTIGQVLYLKRFFEIRRKA